MMDWNCQTIIQATQWLESIQPIPVSQSALSTTDRKALQAVLNTIQTLEKMGVPPPHQLVQQRDDMLARELTLQKFKVSDEVMLSLEALIATLSTTLKAAREKRDHLRQCTTGASKKYFGITLADLIADGHILPQTKLELRWLKGGPIHEGTLCDDGKVLANTGTEWRRFDSLSSAAAEIAGRSLNGWEVWSMIGSDGRRTPMIEVRGRYLKSIEESERD
jgi:hypothetical protein